MVAMSDDDDMPQDLLTVEMTDISVLAEALSDGNSDRSWWFQTSSGDVRPFGDWSEGFDEDDLEDQGWVIVDGGDSRGAFDDMATFAQAVGDPRAGDVLRRCLEGKGAFRRFRDAMRTFPELREPWSTWSEARAEARAVRWLLDRGYVPELDADSALVERHEMAQAALDDVGGRRGAEYQLIDAPGQWREIVESLERGESVSLTRDGATFASITPYGQQR
jgi:hypothetical protein